jgi:hypothetical protein
MKTNKRTRTALAAIAALMVSTACCAAAAARADAQGWNGPGWYISDSTASQPPAAILFEGPHVLQSECVAVYDRFYSPIGICRFLNAKPRSFRG